MCELVLVHFETIILAYANRFSTSIGLIIIAGNIHQSDIGAFSTGGTVPECESNRGDDLTANAVKCSSTKVCHCLDE